MIDFMLYIFYHNEKVTMVFKIHFTKLEITERCKEENN